MGFPEWNTYRASLRLISFAPPGKSGHHHWLGSFPSHKRNKYHIREHKALRKPDNCFHLLRSDPTFHYPPPSCCLKCGTNYRLSFSIVAGMPLLVDSYSFSDICYKVKYVSKAQKKPSSKLHIIQKIVNILLGITTIIKVIHDMLKGWILQPYYIPRKGEPQYVSSILQDFI